MAVTPRIGRGKVLDIPDHFAKPHLSVSDEVEPARKLDGSGFAVAKLFRILFPMTPNLPVSRAIFESLRRLDTCTTSNAIERLNVRPRNEGFISGLVKCQFPQLPPMLGYAATARIRTATPPASAPSVRGGCYHDRIDWWNWLASLPEPRVMVIEDVELAPGIGAFAGQIHAAIARALNCVGCVTNCAVRDLAVVETLGFHLFAASVAILHADAHIVEFGTPVSIGGLTIDPGDLVDGDRHGIHVIPLEIAAEVPDVARRMLDEDNELLRFCESRDFSLPELSRRVQSIAKDQPSLVVCNGP